ncbi:hypothetical protein G9A89_016956 [Geosiphon pyriformis]|nr:hypothetical protein G9A89_016956 [Geosiphon pyriformis]
MLAGYSVFFAAILLFYFSSAISRILFYAHKQLFTKISQSESTTTIVNLSNDQTVTQPLLEEEQQQQQQQQQQQELLTNTIVNMIEDAEFGNDCTEYSSSDVAPPPSYNETVTNNPPKYDEVINVNSGVEPDEESRRILEETRVIYRALVSAGLLDGIDGDF